MRLETRTLSSLVLAAIRVRRATGAPAGAERGSWGPASDGERGSAGAKPPGWSLLVVSALAATVAAQDRPLRDPRVFQASIDLVSVTVTVQDHDGRLVTDLSRDAFDVYEDGEAQAVTQFTRERVPVSLGILIDTSDSMFGRRIQDARDAVERFVADLLDPADEFAIVAFNHQPRFITRWTGDRAGVSSALQQLRPSGATAVYDAIVSALPLVDVRHRQR